MVTVSVVFNFLMGTLPYLAICLETNGVTHCHLRTFIPEFAAKYASKGEKRGATAYVGQNNLLWDLGVEAKDVSQAKVCLCSYYL